MMRSCASVFMALLVLFSNHAIACMGCNLAYDFCTRAYYKAPQTGYVIKVAGAGHVAAGHDLSEDHYSVAMVCPTAESPGKAFRITRTGPSTAKYDIREGESGVVTWDFQTQSRALTNVFRHAGFSRISGDEIAETMRVFENVARGPKGTTLPGQTKSLTVNFVDFFDDVCKQLTPTKWLMQTSAILDCPD